MNEALVQAINQNPFEALSDYYAAAIETNTKALDYLWKEFQIDSATTLEQRIGFSDRSLGKELPSADTQAGRDLRDQLKSLGLFKPSGHETLRGRLTFPLYDSVGNITGFQGILVNPRSPGPREITVGEGERSQETGDRERQPKAPELTNPTPPTVCDLSPSTFSPSSSLDIQDNRIIFNIDDRRYRVRGLEKNNAVGSLKVNILASRDDLVHLDAIDLVKARSRASFIKATAAELFVDADLIKRDIGKLLLKLEALQEQRIAELKASKAKPVILTESQEADAMNLLRGPDLSQRIVADMTACGMVGEDMNKLAGYLAATSRKLPSPLAIVIQSSSSAGKTSLMDAILGMMPAEDVNRLSGLTGRSLYYLNSDDIRHKILAVCEDEGIRQAAYALKILQSDGELRQLTTERGQDGRITAVQYHVEGPSQIMLTTTAMDIDEELINRCLVLTVDETKQQTDAIQSLQRQNRTASAAKDSQQANAIRALHQNAQRLIRPLRVINPYAPQLTFRNDKTRTRRDHQKYLTLIDTIALLHQHQRATHRNGDDESIHVEISDIETANRLAGEILGQSLDELSPQTRNCLLLTERFVENVSKANGVSRHAFRFTRRDLREAMGWSDTQLHRHLTRLVNLEYLVVHRGKHGSRFVYELVYHGEGQSGSPFLMGLVNPSELQNPKTLAGGSPSLAG
ncbi:MAG: DNA primase [Planctomycetota bacterium]